MKLLVFSDSHGNTERMRIILSRNPNIDAVLFLGDGKRDVEKLIETAEGKDKMWVTVSGNCDWLTFDIPNERVFEYEGVRFLMLHGHTVGVKSGTAMLEAYARSKDVDIVLCGHTHVPCDEYISGENSMKPLRIFNPGSIGEPRYGKPSFGYIEIQNGNIITNCAEFEE